MKHVDFESVNEVISNDGWKLTENDIAGKYAVYKGDRWEYELVFSEWNSSKDCKLELKDVSTRRLAIVDACVFDASADPRTATEYFLADMHSRYLDEWT